VAWWIVVVVDDPHTPAFPTRSDTPATFPDTPCSNHNSPIIRMARNERDESPPFRLRHPCGSPLLKRTGFYHCAEAYIAVLSLSIRCSPRERSTPLTECCQGSTEGLGTAPLHASPTTLHRATAENARYVHRAGSFQQPQLAVYRYSVQLQCRTNPIPLRV
jgi:hypothetical protein